MLRKKIVLILALLAVGAGGQAWGKPNKYNEQEDINFEKKLRESIEEENPFKLPTLSIPNVLRVIPSAILSAIVVSFYKNATNTIPWCKKHSYLTVIGFFGLGSIAARCLGEKISGKDPEQTQSQIITPSSIGLLIGSLIGGFFGAPYTNQACQIIAEWTNKKQL